jgi:hypothetical protein
MSSDGQLAIYPECQPAMASNLQPENITDLLPGASVASVHTVKNFAAGRLENGTILQSLEAE